MSHSSREKCCSQWNQCCLAALLFLAVMSFCESATDGSCFIRIFFIISLMNATPRIFPRKIMLLLLIFCLPAWPWWCRWWWWCLDVDFFSSSRCVPSSSDVSSAQQKHYYPLVEVDKASSTYVLRVFACACVVHVHMYTFVMRLHS